MPLRLPKCWDISALWTGGTRMRDATARVLGYQRVLSTEEGTRTRTRDATAYMLGYLRAFFHHLDRATANLLGYPHLDQGEGGLDSQKSRQSEEYQLTHKKYATNTGSCQLKRTAAASASEAHIVGRNASRR